MGHRDNTRSHLFEATLVLPLLALACATTHSGGANTDHSDSDAGPRPSVEPSGSLTDSSAPTANSGATSGDQTEASSDDALFEPAWLPNKPANSIPGELTLFASTLRQGAGGFELYAAVRNDGPTPLCGAGLLLEFYDDADQLLGTGSGAVSGQLYQFVDDTVTIWCVETGQTAMTWALNLPAALVLEDLAYITHRFPAFAVDVKPLPSLVVSDVAPFATDAGVAFRGSVRNEGDVPITEPNVSVFPLNQVGRPLGLATSTGTVAIPPNGTWVFETNSVLEAGASTFAFAAGVRPTNP